MYQLIKVLALIVNRFDELVIQVIHWLLHQLDYLIEIAHMHLFSGVRVHQELPESKFDIFSCALDDYLVHELGLADMIGQL